MSDTTRMAGAPDERRPLPPGTRIGDALLVIKFVRAGAIGLSYEGLRLSDQAAVTIVELFPAGIATRGEDGHVVPVRGWEAELSAARDRVRQRAERLDAVRHPAITGPGPALDALGTTYRSHLADADPTLESWIRDLLRRPSAADLARLFGDVAAGLSRLHAAGLAHGALVGSAVHVSEAGRARLVDLMLSDADAESGRAADVAALARLLYLVITGREPPPASRDRSLDMRFAASHIAAGDYPEALLEAVDDALELGEGKAPVDAADWLARFGALTDRLCGGSADVSSSGEPERAAAAAPLPPPADAPASPQPAPRPAVGDPDEPPRRRSSPVLPLVAAGLVAAGIGLVALLLGQTPTEPPAGPELARVDPPPATPPAEAVTAAEPVEEPTVAAASPQVAEVPVEVSVDAPATPERDPDPVVAAPDPVAAEPPPVAPEPPPPAPAAVDAGRDAPAPAPDPEPAQIAESAPEPEPEPAPEPASESATPPAPSLADVAAASDRDSLLALLEHGADPEAVEARLEALGYVALSSGAERIYRRPGEAEAWRDCAGVCPELVLVPAGDVTMTVAIGDSVRTLAFEIAAPIAVGRFEVTRGEFAAFARETGRIVEPGCYARRPDWRLEPDLSWENPGFAQDDDHPAVCISHEDAAAYLVWLSARTGIRYRLPTDAEWHYLANAEAWPIAPDGSDLCGIGNGADRAALVENAGWTAAACDDAFVATAPVGSFAAGPWGLHDLNGNVWEWVETCAPEPRADAPFPPPTCPPGEPRLLRGGSWADAPDLRRLDSRVISATTIRDRVAGFRVVRDP